MYRPEDNANSDEEIDSRIRATFDSESNSPTEHQDGDQVQNLELTNQHRLTPKALTFTSIRYFDDEADSANSSLPALGAANVTPRDPVYIQLILFSML